MNVFVYASLCFHLCNKVVNLRCITTRTGSDVFTDCSNQHLDFVPNIPYDTTRLDLSKNRFQCLKNYTFTGLSNVRYLQLHSSRISVIESKTFHGLYRLVDLNLNKNSLYSLPSTMFIETPSLKTLDIAENSFVSYPEDALQHLPNLEILKINGLNNRRFGYGFQSLKKLYYLEFFPCIITTLQNETFIVFNESLVTHLKLNCLIGKIEAGALKPFASLSYLYIEWNRLRLSKLLTLLTSFEDKNMTTIDFTGNFVISGETDVLQASTFSLLGVACIKEVDLTRNQISVIQSKAIQQMKYKNCLQKLILKENAIGKQNIDFFFQLSLLNNLYWLDLSNQASVKSRRSSCSSATSSLVEKRRQNSAASGLLEKRRQNCATSSLLEKRRQNSASPSLLEKRRQNVLGERQITFHFTLPKQLHHLDMSKFSGGTNKVANVNFTNGYNLEYLNLAGLKFENCAGHILGLSSLKTLLISEFNCSILDLNMLRYLPNLTSLVSRKTYLNVGLKNDTEGKFLQNLNVLEEIDISGNEFEFLHKQMFESQFKSLVSLDLSNNKLTKIPFNINKFKKLNKLNLAKNQIDNFEKEDINQLDNYMLNTGNMLHLLLKGNNFDCDCDSIHFIEWLQNTKVILDNMGDYPCKYIDKTRKTTKYAYENLEQMRNICMSKIWLNISIILGVILIVIFTTSIIAYRYRITIHYWYLNIRRKYRHYSALEGDCSVYKYDVFVAYCQTDQEWVCEILVNFLEEQKHLRLCLHDRDFAVGKLIMDNIMDAISESRKTLIVVSCAFLESTWCTFELDMARMKMFRENRDMLVVILLDKLSPSQMPVSLMRIWNNVTCLEVDGESRRCQDNTHGNLFWKRLYEAIVL